MVTNRKVEVDRISIISNKTFEEAVAALEASVGRPNMAEYMKEMMETRTYAEIEAVMQKAAAGTGFMIFMSLDLGWVVRRESGLDTPKIKRYLIGNGLIMKEMTKHIPDAGSYAPVTILVDERPDGVHFSYDRIASFLAPYENQEALAVARDLDLKVENLLMKAAT